MLAFLKQPFNPMAPREKFFGILFIGLFLFLFLLFFQPFGVNNYDPRERITLQFTLILFSMGVFTSLVLLINEFLLFPLIFKGPVNRMCMMLWLAWSFILVGTSIFLFYNILGEWHDFRVKSWLEFIGNFTALGILPLIGFYLYDRLHRLQQMTHTNEDYLVDAATTVHIPSENQKEEVRLALEAILYFESEDNYVAVHFMHQEQPSKTLVRTTLKNIEELNPHPALVRCHRSYMVNLLHMIKYNGTRQRGTLSIEHVSTPFPVSRSYAAEIVARIS